MTLPRWSLSRWFARGRAPRAPAVRKRGTRLTVERLEDRCLLSGFLQTNLVSDVPGLAQFTDQNGKQTYCSFVVRGNRPADYVYLRPTTTDCAYNNWGGWSLYTNPTVGVKVSFNRPDWNGGGTGGLFQLEIGALGFGNESRLGKPEGRHLPRAESVA